MQGEPWRLADFFGSLLAMRSVHSMVQERRAQREQSVAGKGKRQAGDRVIERHEPNENVEDAGKNLG